MPNTYVTDDRLFDRDLRYYPEHGYIDCEHCDTWWPCPNGYGGELEVTVKKHLRQKHQVFVIEEKTDD